MYDINWDDFKVRCSAISKVQANSQSNPVLTEKQAQKLDELEKKPELTEKQKAEMAELLVKKENGKKIVLSNTCIEYLMEVYAWETQKMIPVNKESLDLMAIKKGRMAEIAAGTMLCKVDKVLYKEHKERIYNDYLSGEIDLYEGEQVMKALAVVDIKNAFDYPIFLKKIHTGLEQGQREQVQGYCDITTAKIGWIANCLVDNPDEIIEDMKWKIARKMNAVTIEGTEFLEEWKKWERSMRFSHIPEHKRVFKIRIDPFTNFERQRLYDKVKVCREWLFNFDNQYQKLNT